MSGKRATRVKVKPRQAGKTKNLKRMTRSEFESLFEGRWERMKGDRWRENGDFRTRIHDQWKVVSDGKHAIRATTWAELAHVLKINR